MPIRQPGLFQAITHSQLQGRAQQLQQSSFLYPHSPGFASKFSPSQAMEPFSCARPALGQVSSLETQSTSLIVFAFCAAFPEMVSRSHGAAWQPCSTHCLPHPKPTPGLSSMQPHQQLKDAGDALQPSTSHQHLDSWLQITFYQEGSGRITLHNVFHNN